MKHDDCIVWVSDGGGLDLALMKMLVEAVSEVRRAAGSAEARNVTMELQPPAMVISDTVLHGSARLDAAVMASEPRWQAPGIIVSSMVDISLYITAFENSASDSIGPSFVEQEISYVLDRAAQEGKAIQVPATA